MITIKKQNFLHLLVSFSLLLLFLKTFNFKFLWNYPVVIFSMFSIAANLLFFLSTKFKKIETDTFMLIFPLGVAIILQILANNYEGLIGQCILILTYFLIALLPHEVKKEAFSFIFKVFTIIMVISLIGWILVYIFRINLPYTESEFQHYKFYDYGFFNTRIEGIAFTRFLGMFIEPGYTAVMSVILLSANYKEGVKNRWNKALIICTLFTLSLAGLLMLFIFFVLISLKNKKVMGLLSTLFVIILVVMYIYREDEDFLLTYFVTSRVEDMFSGNITGNRFSDKFGQVWNNNILGDMHNLFFGVGIDYIARLKLNSCGYKVHIAQFGLVETICICFFYLFTPILKGKITRRKLIFLIIWLLSFIDLGYPAWSCFIIIHILGYANLKEKKEVKNAKMSSFAIRI